MSTLYINRGLLLKHTDTVYFVSAKKTTQQQTHFMALPKDNLDKSASEQPAVLDFSVATQEVLLTHRVCADPVLKSTTWHVSTLQEWLIEGEQINSDP